MRLRFIVGFSTETTSYATSVQNNITITRTILRNVYPSHVRFLAPKLHVTVNERNTKLLMEKDIPSNVLLFTVGIGHNEDKEKEKQFFSEIL